MGGQGNFDALAGSAEVEQQTSKLVIQFIICVPGDLGICPGKQEFGNSGDTHKSKLLLLNTQLSQAVPWFRPG